jgi:hypothetical protein
MAKVKQVTAVTHGVTLSDDGLFVTTERKNNIPLIPLASSDGRKWAKLRKQK